MSSRFTTLRCTCSNLEQADQICSMAAPHAGAVRPSQRCEHRGLLTVEGARVVRLERRAVVIRPQTTPQRRCHLLGASSDVRKTLSAASTSASVSSSSDATTLPPLPTLSAELRAGGTGGAGLLRMASSLALIFFVHAGERQFALALARPCFQQGLPVCKVRPQKATWAASTLVRLLQVVSPIPVWEGSLPQR